jgi:DNA-binding FrmR family transcriptional regulator
MSRTVPVSREPGAAYKNGSSLHTPEVKEEIRRRINRLSGQIQAIQRMVEEEAYCSRLLEAHVRHCVLGAARSGTETERRTKIDELVAVFERSMQA